MHLDQPSEQPQRVHLTLAQARICTYLDISPSIDGSILGPCAKNETHFCACQLNTWLEYWASQSSPLDMNLFNLLSYLLSLPTKLDWSRNWNKVQRGSRVENIDHLKYRGWQACLVPIENEFHMREQLISPFDLFFFFF